MTHVLKIILVNDVTYINNISNTMQGNEPTRSVNVPTNLLDIKCGMAAIILPPPPPPPHPLATQHRLHNGLRYLHKLITIRVKEASGEGHRASLDRMGYLQASFIMKNSK